MPNRNDIKSRSLRSLLILIACTLALCISLISYPSFVQSQETETTSFPNLQKIDNRLIELAEDSKNSENTDKYQALRAKIQSIYQQENEKINLSSFAKDLIKRKNNLIEALNKLNKNSTQLEDRLTQLKTIEKIEEAFSSASIQSKEIDQKIEKTNNAIIAIRIDIEAIPDKIIAIENTLSQQQAAINLNAVDQENNLSSWEVFIEYISEKTHLDFLKINLETLPQRLEVNQLALDVLSHDKKQTDKKIEILRKKMFQKLAASSQALIDQASKLSNILKNEPEIIYNFAVSNEKLASDINQLNTQLETIQQERANLEEQRQILLQNIANIKENIQWLKQSPSFSQAIQTQLENIPTISEGPDIAEKITDTYLKRFNYENEKKEIAFSQKNMGLTGSRNALTAQNIEQLRSLMSFRIELLDRILRDTDQYISELTRTQASRKQLNIETLTEKRFLEQQRLLIKDTTAIWQTQFHYSYRTLGNQLKETLKKSIFILVEQFEKILLFFSFLMVFIALKIRLLSTKRWLANRYQPLIGKVKQDKLYNTLSLVGLNMMITSIIPGYILVQLLLNKDLAVFFLEHRLVNLGMMIIILYFLILFFNLCAKKGDVFEVHFGWHVNLTRQLKTILKRHAIVSSSFILLMMIFRYVDNQDKSNFFRITNLVLLGWNIYFTHHILNPRYLQQTMTGITMKSVIIILLKISLTSPLIISIYLTLTGYSIAAFNVFQYYQLFLVVVFSTLFIKLLTDRFLRVEQRRLAYRRALEHRAEQKAKRSSDDHSTPEEIDERQLAIEEVSEQSLSLMNAFVIFFFIISSSIIFRDSPLSVNILENITIWETSNVSDRNLDTTQISLKDILFTCLVFFITIFSVRNIPGLLELLIYRHFTFSVGEAYAITRVAQYGLIIGGIVFGFSSLGFHWSNLQWLVAALGVGLGFGLQEIFANFVSGIILLFERPVSVGDVITINEVTGTVTKINTRATTVKDWDRKEVLIPNKTLITDQLTNWTLSDAINRVVVRVGVAYGTNLHQVKHLLKGITEKNTTLLNEPAPQIIFYEFGDSTLNLEIRVFLPNLDERLAMIDKLHTEINNAFEENNIEISFPQMDIHIKDYPIKNKAELVNQ